MTILLTRKGFEKLTKELDRLLQVERPEACHMVEDTRPIGVVEDNPEYLQAIANQDRVEKQITDIHEVLTNCILFNKSMCKPDTVSFGSTVELINEETDDIKHYTIVSIYESDVSNGLISIECPFVRAMIGCKAGDEFDFGDNTYVINNISYDTSIY